MPLFALEKELYFPPVHLAEPDGMLAVGGDLSLDRLLLAYRQGIFPWYEGAHILWWSPNPRFVLFPETLKVSKSMQQLLKRMLLHLRLIRLLQLLYSSASPSGARVKQAPGSLRQ
nr:hypothetical protein [Paraflavitalea speifideiaquila]